MKRAFDKHGPNHALMVDPHGMYTVLAEDSRSIYLHTITDSIVVAEFAMHDAARIYPDASVYIYARNMPHGELKRFNQILR